MQFKHYTYMPM